MSGIETSLRSSFGLLRSVPQSNEFVEELALSINKSAGDFEIAEVVREEIGKLVAAGLGSLDAAEEQGGVGAVARNGRSVLLRSRSTHSNPRRFPIWVSESLIEAILFEMEEDLQRSSVGDDALSKQWVLMLGANFAAIPKNLQARFIRQLSELVKLVPAFDDPFLRDRVLIAKRTLGMFEG